MYFGSSNGYNGINLDWVAYLIIAIFTVFALIGGCGSVYCIWLYLSAHIAWVG